jgi:hypothetical protein
MTTILQALKLLKTEDDGHWTADGLPRLDVIGDIVQNKALTRDDVTRAAPTFTRDNPTTKVTKAPQEQSILNIPDSITPGETQPEVVVVDLEQLENELEIAKKELEEIQLIIDEAQKNYMTIKQKIDALIESRENNKDPYANQKAITEYLKTQQRLREERAYYNLKAPVDQAMARRTGYGGKRPVYHANTKTE